MRTLLLLSIAPAAMMAQSPFCVPHAHSTQGIQEAIDECSARGGGVAYVGPGDYTIGPLWLKSNVELRLDAGATLFASRDPKDWPERSPALINAFDVKNAAITGSGTIDGRAEHEYLPMRGVDPEIRDEIEIARKANVPLERWYRKGLAKQDVLLWRAENVRLEGVHVVNASEWTIRVQDCDHVWVRGLTVRSDLEKGVNEDGIDIVSSSNVFISDSNIVTGDDAICLKTMRYDLADPKSPVRPTENVVVTNSVLSSSSTAMVIGTETYADIRHVIFSNIVVRDSNRAFGINVQDGADVSDVRFQDVTFELNRRHWNWWGSADVIKFVLKKRGPDSKLGSIHDITVSGAQGTARGTSLIAGTAERRLSNILIEDLRVRMLPENVPDRRATDGLVIQDVDGLTLRDVLIEGEHSNIVLRDVSQK